MTREQLDALPEETLRRVIILPAYCSAKMDASMRAGALRAGRDLVVYDWGQLQPTPEQLRKAMERT
jgi:hypothetical protein